MSPGGIGSGPQIMLALPDRGDERPLCACLSFYYSVFTGPRGDCGLRLPIDKASVVTFLDIGVRV